MPAGDGVAAAAVAKEQWLKPSPPQPGRVRSNFHVHWLAVRLICRVVDQHLAIYFCQ